MCARFQGFVVALLLLAGTSTQAQNWIPVGPPGGSVRALAPDPRDPQRIYLGTADGILYRSDDGGLNWQRLAPGFPLRGCSLDDIAVAGNGAVFVGYREVQGNGGGVVRSNDDGQTFAMLKGVAGESVRALKVSPSNPQVIAAGTLTGVFLSRDGGQGWTRITPRNHADLRNVGSLAFDPSDPQVIYAGTWHLGWKTLDGGATWNPVHNGMIDDSDVMTLTVDRWDPQTIYATACSGVYRSAEGGQWWLKLRGIPFSSRRTRAFSQGADDPKLLMAGTTEGLWISQDGGGTWKRVTPGDLVVNALVVQPNGTIILGTEDAGVLRSSDRGRTWSACNSGFSERFVSRLLFDSTGSRLVVAVWGGPRYGGVFASSGVRGPWVHLGEGLDGRQVLSLAFLGTTILAGTDDGIFTRAPEATVWTRLSTQIQGREVHPRVSELLVVSPGRLLAATTNGVILSPDGGRTWDWPTLGKAGEVFGLAVSPADPELVVAATPIGNFRSTDGGDNWRQVSTGLLGVTPHALVFLPSDDRVLFATTSGGLFRSGDQGGTWRLVTGGIPHSALTGFAVHPDGRTIYACDFTWGGIFRSTNSGLTWARMPTDGLASDRAWTLGLDPATPEQLLVGSSAGGLHLLVPKPLAALAPASR